MNASWLKKDTFLFHFHIFIYWYDLFCPLYPQISVPYMHLTLNLTLGGTIVINALIFHLAPTSGQSFNQSNCAHCTHAKSLQMLEYCRKPSGKHRFHCDLFLKTAKNLSVSTCVHPSSLFAKLMLLHKQIQDVATSKPPLTLIEVGFYRRAVYCVCFILRHLCCFILHHLCMYGCDVPYLLPVTLSLFSLFLKNI